MALNIYDKNNLYKLVETKDIEKNINVTESLSAGLNVYTGSKTKSNDGKMGAVLSSTGNLHLTSTTDNSPGIYFYRSLSTSATHTILALSDSFQFSKGITTNGNISSHSLNVLTKVVSVSQDNITVTKGSSSTVTISVDEANWTPIGAICCHITNATSNGTLASNCNAYGYYSTNTSAVANIHNFNSSTDAKIKVTMYVLMRYSG
jgi:hypothetical protein